MIVNGEEMSGNVKARETLHGGWPLINAHRVGCPVHQDWPARTERDDRAASARIKRARARLPVPAPPDDDIPW